ncbi:MAG: DUF368 domain-containing protein [Clostridia bacterium]|nr:DUF368 domain-containing protein [Clostridia bacterium]
MKSFLYRILCGFCLGISIFAPGISGSIMAIIMGIYDKLLDIASNPFKNFKNNFKFLFPMGIGALLSLVLFILAFSYLFETYEKAVFMLFLGLIIGNLPMVYKEARKSDFKWYYIIGTIAAFAVALTVGIMSEGTGEAQVAQGNTGLIYIAISGALSGFASLVPGMSVSMILIVMGVYDHLIASAKALDVVTVGVVGVAFVLSMIFSSKLIKYVFAKHSGMAHFMVLGFLIGSVSGIFVTLPKGGSVLAGTIMLVIGLAVSLLFVYLGKKVNIEDRN